MAVAVKVTGSAHDVGRDAARRSIGLVARDVPARPKPPVSQWSLAPDDMELAEQTAGGPIGERHAGVLALGAATS